MTVPGVPGCDRDIVEQAETHASRAPELVARPVAEGSAQQAGEARLGPRPRLGHPEAAYPAGDRLGDGRLDDRRDW